MRPFLLLSMMAGLNASSLFDLYLPRHNLQNALWFSSSPNTLSQLREKNYTQERYASIIGNIQQLWQTNPDGVWSFGYYKESRTNITIEPHLVTLLSQDSVNSYSLKEDGTLLPLDGRGYIYQVEGVFLKRTFHHHRFSGFVLARFLSGIEYIDLDIEGEAARDTGETDFALQLSHHYYHKNLLTQNRIYRHTIPQAVGYGVDLSFAYQLDHLILTWGTRNLLSRMRWENLIAYEADVNSRTRYLGDDGYHHLRPMVEGRYRLGQTLHRQLSREHYITTETFYNDLVFKWGQFHFDQAVTMQGYAISYKGVELSYTTKIRTLSLGYYRSNFFAALSSDFLHYDSAKQLQLSMGYSF